MTGLLSVFSLLPIQNQKKRENGQEEERDSEGMERNQDNEDKGTLHDTSGSTDGER